jgi:hypothetical protein
MTTSLALPAATLPAPPRSFHFNAKKLDRHDASVLEFESRWRLRLGAINKSARRRNLGEFSGFEALEGFAALAKAAAALAQRLSFVVTIAVIPAFKSR